MSDRCCSSSKAAFSAGRLGILRMCGSLLAYQSPKTQNWRAFLTNLCPALKQDILIQGLPLDFALHAASATARRHLLTALLKIQRIDLLPQSDVEGVAAEQTGLFSEVLVESLGVLNEECEV